MFVMLPTTQGKANAKPIPTKATIVSGILNTAENLIGTRYCRGGTGPRCFDCSGFVEYVFAQEGIDIPRMAHDQYKMSTPIPRRSALPGDLVFFKYNSGWIYHVGIYYGDGMVLHSPKPGGRVKIEQIWTNNISFGRI